MKAAGIIVLLILAGAGLALVMHNAGGKGGNNKRDPHRDSSGLDIKDIQEGTGREAKSGDRVSVFYTGTLKDGTKFDSNVGKQPLTFTIGNDSVIEGWHRGFLGMKEGGKRRLVIPADLAYGAKGYPPVIPPNAELTFDVELVKVN